MKILMINPSSSAPENKREYILGIPYLVSALRAAGYADIESRIFFNAPWTETQGLTQKAVEELKPDIVLISCFTINRVAGFKTAELVKKINPAIKIIMGGMHPSFMYRQILEALPVDVVCVGEGDETIVEIADAFRKNTPLDNIKGIAIKKNGKVVMTGRREFVKNLDTLPFPAHDIYRDYLIASKRAHVITSRGCPYGCQFCSTTEFWGRSWRARSAKNVVDEIEMLIREYGINYVNFLDDEFTLQRKRTLDICNELLSRNVKIKWSCSTRVNTIDREQLEYMTKSGCDHIVMGIESGSPKIIKTIGKKISLDQIEKAFDLLKEFGLSRGAFLMVGNPGEDFSTVKETIELVKRLDLDVQSVAVAEIYPGTQLFELAKKNGFITDDYWLTESPPPFFTIEHSAEKLQWWGFLIVLSSKRLRGNLNAARFILKFAFSKKQKIARYFKRVLVKNKNKYTHKEY
ncbi:MAG: radical SAM protein [Deltaproteobacteria bacterium]|nr:radical SAM protein [Deltaproteobacteria bacterium]